MTLRRYLTGLIWLCIAPLLLLAVWLAVDHVQDLHDRTAASAERIARRAESSIDDALRTRLDALRLLAESPLAGDVQHQDLYYDQALRYATLFNTVVIKADPRTRAMHFTTRRPLGSVLPPLAPASGRSAVDMAMRSGKGAIGDAFPGPITGAGTVALAVPGDRRVAAAAPFVLIAAIELPQLADWLARTEMPDGWALRLRDSRGTLLAHRGPSDTDGDDAALHLRHDLALAPWTVELTVPAALYREPTANAAVAGAAAIVLVTLAGVVGGGLAARRLSRAIHGLTLSPMPAAADAPGAAIQEVATVRALLADATERRERAEAQRREDERQHRVSMEQAAARLQMSEARLRAIVDGASEGIVTIDGDQRIVMVNRAAACIFGHAPDAMLGRPVTMLIPERYRERHGEQIRAYGEAGSAARPMGRRQPLAGLRAGGEEFPLEAAISQVRVGGEHLYTVVLRDVGERLRIDAEVRTAKAKLEAALESMSDAVLITDAEGRFIDFNEAFATFHRFRSKDDCHRTLQGCAQVVEVCHADGTPAPLSIWAVPRALRGEVGRGVDYQLRRRDTGERWSGSYSYAPIRGPGGAIVGSVVVARDVTELRRLHDELQASHAALRGLVAAQDQVQEGERRRIARELHDELQQTLAAMRLDAELIARRLGGGDPDLRALLTHIGSLAQSAIHSTRRIINDLRPQMLEDLGLRAALATLAGDFTRRTGIACAVSAGPDDASDDPADLDDDAELPAAVVSALYRIAQEALNNIARHAGATHVEVSLEMPRGGGLRLSIRDDGRGLDAADRAKPGSFGLVGMSERVRSIGAVLRVESAPAAGTLVGVDVPAAALAAAAPPADAATAGAPAGSAG